jgi:hypothetical protein
MSNSGFIPSRATLAASSSGLSHLGGVLESHVTTGWGSTMSRCAGVRLEEFPVGGLGRRFAVWSGAPRLLQKSFFPVKPRLRNRSG